MQKTSFITHVKHRRGFTLVELLVTITIVVVLAALGFMAIRSVREKARLVNALTSMRQVATLHVAYSTEHQGYINTTGGSTVGLPGAMTFWERFQPYFISDMTETSGPKEKAEFLRILNSLLNTADADTMSGTALSGPKIYHDGHGLPVPYAFNSNVYNAKNLLKVSAFQNPEQMIYAVYGRFKFDEGDGNAYAPMETNGRVPTNNIFYLSDHKAMAIYLDGHVESLGAPFPKTAYGNVATTVP